MEFKPAIPNGDATLTFKLASGKRVRLHLDKWTLTKKEKADQEEQIREGQPTTKLRVSWNTTLDGISDKDLPSGLKVRIYSYEYPPEAITPDPMIRRIATDLNEIKVLQNLNRGH